MKKKFIILLTITGCLLYLTACQNKTETKENENTPQTPATILSSTFPKIIKEENDIIKAAEKISQNEIIKTKTMVEEKEPNDYLSGFDDKITGYKRVVAIQPVISSIPFIAYIFETNDPGFLQKELKNNANLRWNICTEADETSIAIEDNYVFFVMSPNSFDE